MIARLHRVARQGAIRPYPEPSLRLVPAVEHLNFTFPECPSDILLAPPHGPQEVHVVWSHRVEAGGVRPRDGRQNGQGSKQESGGRPGRVPAIRSL